MLAPRLRLRLRLRLRVHAAVTYGNRVCEPQRGGFVCGFEGKAQCMLEVAQTKEGEACDTGPDATAKSQDLF